ncbi:MAG: DEAD/DEAH box helicase [Flavobacteriia bacterium]|nr:DEAD/DEAH box helicase [Flavobacteriia bacterium]
MSKNLPTILAKLGIESLNEMQERTLEAFEKNAEVVLLSPTGTGKTLAFVLPLLDYLDAEKVATQALILTPSRELAIQIEQVIREMGTGLKTNAVYGGRSAHKDRMDLNHAPTILIGTPGRVADHIRRNNVDTSEISTLILDEFDKSLETGFEGEMREIIGALPNLKKKVLTSATQKVDIPEFVGISNATRLNYTSQRGKSRLEIKKVTTKDKMQSLIDLLRHLGDQNGIIFCNFKDSISRVSEGLDEAGIDHGCFYGGMEQRDREHSLIRFRNETHTLLLATDLAARGLDVPEMDFIIHFELPIHEEEFTHRNGRTARMKSEGKAFVLQQEGRQLPSYMYRLEEEELKPGKISPPRWSTLFITGGRRDKISKGDIAGLFFKQGGLDKNELGKIELSSDSAYVAVPRAKANKLVSTLNNARLKTKRVRISILD